MNAGEVSDAAVEAAARAFYIADNSNPEWAARAWDDMGGSEPSAERADLLIAMGPALTAALPHLSPRPDADRPFVVTVESTLVNGEDDVMSPEPPVTVWASDADAAHNRAVEGKGYDTNLIEVRVAVASDFPAPAPVDDREALR